MKQQENNSLVSHNSEGCNFDEVIKEATQRIINLGATELSTVEERMDLFSDVKNSEVGRFLLENRGVNAYWYDYVTRFVNHSSKEIGKFDSFLINKAPITIALREYSKICQNIIQDNLREGISLGSIPCGSMAELLTLDCSNIENIIFTGVDLDYESLLFAHELANYHDIEGACTLIQANAKDINLHNKFHIVISDGWNAYDKSTPEIRDDIYGNVYNSLKSGGVLITNILTPTPDKENCPWNMDFIDSDHLRLQAIYFSEIINSSWNITYSCEDIFNILKKIGFKDIEIIYDRAKICPTVIAKKT